MKANIRFVFVTGGVCSSLGKGVLISSLGVLLKSAGYSVCVGKMDPYLNVDPGTMSPLVHGEVFVTHDGAETDLDLGHYERMLGVHLSADSSVSSGQIFQEVLEGERTGEYLGRCIQMVPHVVDAIKNRLVKLAESSEADVVLVEIGGTVGDIEGEIFLESLRQLKLDLGEHLLHCHLSFVPFLQWAQEFKTKPTQHSVMLLKRAGLTPDALFLRADSQVPEKALDKLSVMCGVNREMLFQVPTHSPVYELFSDLERQEVATLVQKKMGLQPRSTNLHEWQELVDQIKQDKPVVRIGMVVKYIGTDPYISVVEAIKSASWAVQRTLELVVIPAQDLEDESTPEGKRAWQELRSVEGIVVPGGFDERGLQGKMNAVRFARENKVPLLGICLGMQVMLIEAAVNLLGLQKATTTEVDPNTPHPIICLLEEQREVTQKGASMRLGAYECTLGAGTKARELYGREVIQERHRHRYEFNNAYREQLESAGVVFSGINTEHALVEIVEYKDHPYMISCQFHPEFLSTPLVPHPLFLGLLQAAVEDSKC